MTPTCTPRQVPPAWPLGGGISVRMVPAQRNSGRWRCPYWPSVGGPTTISPTRYVGAILRVGRMLVKVTLEVLCTARIIWITGTWVGSCVGVVSVYLASGSVISLWTAWMVEMFWAVSRWPMARESRWWRRMRQRLLLLLLLRVWKVRWEGMGLPSLCLQ